MWVTLLVSYTLFFTLPAYNAEGPGGCSPGLVPLSDLSRLEIRGVPRWATYRDTLLYSEDAVDSEGTQKSVTLELDGVWSVWAVTLDAVGNRSCDSPFIGLGLPPTSVPVAPPSVTECCYDIAGRHVKPPLPPGIYFQYRRRVVIVR